jgi:methyl-accepting chemotaxis protein
MSKMAISRFSVLQQIVFLALVAVAGLLALSLASYLTIGQVKVNGPIYQEIVQGKDLVADILPPPEYVIESYLVVLQAGHEPDAGKLPQYLGRLKKLKGEYDERHAYWVKELRDGEQKTLLVDSSYQPAVAFYATSLNDFFPALQGGDRVKAAQAIEKLTAQYETHRQQIDKLVTLTNARDELIEKQAAGQLKKISAAMLTLCLLLVAGCVVMSAFVIRSIRGTFLTCTSITDAIAGGDLSVQVTVAGQGSIRLLLASLRAMVEKYRLVVDQMGNTSNILVASSTQLSNASEEIAASAENAAAESITMATASEEMAATSHEISRNCHQAADSSQQTSNIARAGVEVVQSTIGVMQQIAGRVKGLSSTVELLGQRSDQIGAIIGTIEDIADQTNLLALNAAIEAARAGEQGRGFAVVADEVRALAERTTRATREIGDMIKAIQSETRGVVSAMEQGVLEVESGTSEATRSSEALQDILDQVNNVSSQITQIAGAAEEQTATTGMISGNIQQITTLVQNSAQGAHQCAGQAGQLNACALDLKRIIAQFRLA